MRLPLIRLQPWFPGQMGVEGSDVPRGLRFTARGIVLYVDDNHPNASDAHDGTDPEYPKATIQAAVNSAHLVEGSVIVVDGEATIAESVVIAATRPHNCSIVGAGVSQHHPQWQAAIATEYALTVRAEGWTIEGFTFECPSNRNGIKLEEVPASGISAYKTIIRDCIFDGLWGGRYGIDFFGAPHRVTIEGCKFLEFRRGDGSAWAIVVTDSSHTNPYECEILGNLFWENENHIGSIGAIRSFNVSLFQGNVLHEGDLIPATIMLDLRGGSRGNNIVVGNYFCGDYSQPGGYWGHAGTPDNWVGNFAEDVTEVEVGDNGITVAPPAA